MTCPLNLHRYPLADANDIAPGMCAEVELHFTPDSLADYDDELIVLTQHGRLQLPLRGRRPPPVLTLPSIDAGDVLLGNVRRMQVRGGACHLCWGAGGGFGRRPLVCMCCFGGWTALLEATLDAQ